MTAPNLAVLQCEGCGKGSGLCKSCDGRVHAHLDNDAHTRTFLSDDALPRTLQSASFVLAGFKGEHGQGLKLQFQDSMASYAGRIWPGSMMLARYLETLSTKEPDYFSGNSIIELGAGYAVIMSLTAWLLGARECVATDMNEDGFAILEDHFEGNEVAAASTGGFNVSSSNVNVKSLGILSSSRLAFGDERVADRFDVILGSFILYDPDSFVPLAFTPSQLMSSPRTVALLTSHEPTRESALLEALSARGLGANSRAVLSFSSSGGAGRGASNLGTGLRSTSILIVSPQ